MELKPKHDVKFFSDIGSFSQLEVYGIGRAKEHEESCSLVVPRASAGMYMSEGDMYRY